MNISANSTITLISEISSIESIKLCQRSCICGSFSHKRIAHKDCNLRTYKQNDKRNKLENIGKNPNFNESDINGLNIMSNRFYIGNIDSI